MCGSAAIDLKRPPFEAHHGFRQRGTYAPLDFVIPSLGFGGGNERPNAAVKLVAEVPVVGLLF